MFPADPKIKTPLENVRDSALLQMNELGITSDEYGTALDRVKQLHKMQLDAQPAQVNPDTLVVAATNLVGILLILRYERLDIITSKALSFVQKIR